MNRANIVRQDRVRTDGVRPIHFDAGALADELRTKIRGDVYFDAGARALYTTDGSNYRQVPIGVSVRLSIASSWRPGSGSW
jgi:hypothetical protein